MSLADKVDPVAFREFQDRLDGIIKSPPIVKMIDFDISCDRLLGHEGGYVNDPDDPGGETQWGISKRSYPNVDIKNLTKDQAKAIYKNDFWNVVNRGKAIPGSVMYQLFDFAVNSGIETAIRYLQRSCNVADDGNWGPISQKAVEGMSESDLLMIFTAERLEFMSRLSNWKFHGKGWARRIAKQLRYAAQDNIDILE